MTTTEKKAPTKGDKDLAKNLAIDIRVVVRDAQSELDELRGWADLIDKHLEDGDPRDLFSEHIVIRTEELLDNVTHMHSGSTYAMHVRHLRARLRKVLMAAGPDA